MTTTTATTAYVARDTMTIRVEMVRQLRRRRTLIAFGLALALPLLPLAQASAADSTGSRHFFH